MSAWALLFALVAFSLTVCASYGCFYVSVTIPDGTKIGGFTFEGSMGFGFVSHSTNGYQINGITYSSGNYECTPWSSDAMDHLFDAAWTTARVFGVLAYVCIGISMLAAFVMSCMSFSKNLIRVFTGLLFLGSLCELLTFVAFASSVCTDYNCKFDTGAGLAIGGSIAAFIAGILFSKIPLADRDDDFIPAVISSGGGGEAPGTVTVQETVEPDGTKKIVKTTVNEDGSKTVVESIERPETVEESIERPETVEESIERPGATVY